MPKREYDLQEFKLGEMMVDFNGRLHLCTAPGTPGSWRQVLLSPTSSSQDSSTRGPSGFS